MSEVVLDASVVTDLLTGVGQVDRLVEMSAQRWHAPAHLDVEVTSALRGLVLGRKLTPERAEQARTDHFDFLITRHDTAPLAERIWSLRHQYTSYDAAYLALAEALDAPLHTCDAKLDSGGHRATVRVHDSTH